MNKLFRNVYDIIRGGSFMKKTYTLIIHDNIKEIEEGNNVPRYWAQCLQIPGAITQGETIEEIKKNMQEAIELMLSPDKDAIQEENIILKRISLEVANA